MAFSDIIKYEGDNEILVWKHPNEDFNTTTQLIVHDSQEAIFFRNGQALDLFPSGRHTLETQNIPFIKRLLNLPTSGKTPFHCEVYYINKVHRLNLKWGTRSKAEVLDPKFNILLNVGANGGLGLSIEDARKFLLKLVGTENSLTTEGLTGYFREVVSTRVKTYLTTIMSEVSFVVVNSHLDDISKALHSKLKEDFAEFGINLANFYLSTIHIPDEDKLKVKEALSNASSRNIQGYNWADEQIADIAKKYAANPGSGDNVAGMLAQAPVAFAFGQMLNKTVSPMMGKSFTSTFSPTGTSGKTVKCPKCGEEVDDVMSFCPKCGNKMPKVSYCTNCGTEMKPDYKFCPKCGTPK